MTTYAEWTRPRQCGNKIAWPSAKEAKRRQRESADAYGEPRTTWDHYRCPHCHYWHTGHKGATP